MLKFSRCVVAVALSLTLLPGVGRCDDVPNSKLIMLLIKLAQPKKPEWAKPMPCTAAHCPMGVCSGAATLPCCPVMHVEACTAVCPIHKPEAHCRPCCEPAGCCKAEHTLAEMRALCAEQARMLQEMRVMMKEMHTTINAMQIEVQLLRQNQVIYPTTPVEPMPYGTKPSNVPEQSLWQEGPGIIYPVSRPVGVESLGTATYR